MLPPSQSDITLHALSLQIAAAYHLVAVGDFGPVLTDNDEALVDILTAYRCIRRHISKGVDGKRYGAESAHKMMQGGI
jgi:hypothetical protein